MSMVRDFLKLFQPAAAEISEAEQRRLALQMVRQLLAFKEARIVQLRKEIECCVLSAPLLDDESEEGAK